MDTEDSLNKINHFPSDINFQTFLLDRSNKVVAIGNPVHNPKIKELYIKILDPNRKNTLENSTEITVSSTTIDFGKFEEKQRDTVLYIKNIGKEKLIILDAVASCGCTIVDYDKRPISPNDSLALKILYSADKKGYFNKIVNLYCNIKSSPVQFHIVGTVQ
ncbi:MAG: DUF1573 domain-containing protein [Bacteroides sp.]|nr:DUF1573 domain-containing protein [Bacteroides sp.]